MTDISFDKKRWDFHLEEQKQLCKKVNVELVPVRPFDMVALAFPTSGNPFNALRHPPDNNCGWFLWVGEYSEADDFYKPVHAVHLLDYRPAIMKYLGLPAGYRVQIDDNGYEDIWYDASLLLV
jgi:hypothetical protein